jgi:hypothetical protein
MSVDEELRQLRTTVQYLKDRQDILDCITREARGRDRFDAALTSSCYWEDGADEHGTVVTPGPEYGEKANAGHQMAFAANCHNLTNHLCEIDGDTAYCETYVIGGLLSHDKKSCKLAMGRYFDQLERRNGVWKIKRRRGTVDMVVEGDASWLSSPAVRGFMKGQRSKDDPSYQRPIEFNSAHERW